MKFLEKQISEGLVRCRFLSIINTAKFKEFSDQFCHQRDHRINNTDEESQ